MSTDHVSIEDLAAYAAGDLDAAEAVTVEAHVVLCAECRADVDALRATAAALGATGSPAMPADIAARLDAALAAEASGVAATSSAPAGNVLPMAPRRRRPTYAGVAAVAAGVALVAAISIPLVTGSSGGGARDSALTSGADSGAQAESVQTRRLSSGLAYTRESLASTLSLAIAGNAAPTSQDTAATRAPNLAGSPLPGRASAPPAAGAPLNPASSTTRLQTDVGRLGACITELVGGLPSAGRTPLVVDFGRFEGRDAMVIVFPTVMSNGRLRANRVDVFVVGPGCGEVSGGDVLDFQRIPRPPL